MRADIIETELEQRIETIERPGGRQLAFAQYGDREGFPLVYCHGYPSSRREALLLHPAAERQGARVIAIDRPGYGGSDHQSNRKLLDYSDDVAAVTDYLGIERFALLGLSGGGPYALGLAHRIPERIGATTLSCPLGPVFIDECRDQMQFVARVSWLLAKQAPIMVHAIFAGLASMVLSQWPQAMDDLRTLGAPPADDEVLADEVVRHILALTVVDSMRRQARGPRHDPIIYARPWDIPFETIEPPIEIWHGEADGTVPVSHSHWYAEHLPNAELIIKPDEGHYSMPLRFADQMLESLAERFRSNGPR